MANRSKKRSKTATVGLTLRLREDLRGRLEEEATRRKTSLNSEVIRRLERSLMFDELDVFVQHAQKVITDTGEEIIQTFKRRDK